MKRRLLFSLAVVLSPLIVSCGDDVLAPGRFSVVFDWGSLTPPTTADNLWVWGRVEQRDPRRSQSPGELLVQTDLVPWRDEGVTLDFSGLPNGEDRVVIVEFKPERSRDASVEVRYYGQSEPFELRAGSDLEVPVAISLATHPSTELPAGAVEIEEATPLGTSGQITVNTPVVTLLVETAEAPTILLANDPAFSKGLVVADLEAGGSGPFTDNGDGRLRFAGWDLDDGICGEGTPYGCIDGLRTVYAVYLDEFGNRGPRFETQVTLDSTPPAVVDAVLTRTPTYPYGYDDATRVLSTGITDPMTDQPVAIEVIVYSNEPLDISSASALSASGPGPLTFTRIDASALAVRYRVVLDASAVDGTYALSVTWTDLAGNVGTDVPLLGGLRVDRAPPISAELSLSAPAEQPAAIQYRRAPWGTEDSGALPFEEVRGAAGAIANPADNKRVLVYRSEQMLAGDLIGWADVAADGSFYTGPLTGGAQGTVYLSLVDTAGTKSLAYPVEEIEWVATLGRKSAGDSTINPHTFENVPLFGLRLHPAGAEEPVGVGGLADGSAAVQSGVGAPWTRHSLNVEAPTARASTAVLDTRRGRWVMFGGAADGPELDETWEWDGTRWELRLPVDPEGDGNPVARFAHCMAYDEARARVVLFGGRPGSGYLGDVWEWDGVSWALREPEDPEADQNPQARSSCALAYDPSIERVVLFGGYSSFQFGNQFFTTYFSDTWVWDGNSWENRSAPERPSGRSGHEMVYDPGTGELVLFGGTYTSIPDIGFPVTSYFSDTWAWDGTGWHERAPGSGTPDGRYEHRLVSSSSGLLLFGGRNASGYFEDTWRWNGTAWSLANGSSAGLTPRGLAAVAVDPIAGEPLLFGGGEYSSVTRVWDYFAGTWRWNGSQWTAVAPGDPEGDGNPVPRRSAEMAYDDTLQEIVLFGGYDGAASPLADTWTWSGTSWRFEGSATQPGSCTSWGLTTGANGRVLLFCDGNPWEWNGSGWVAKTTPTSTPGSSNSVTFDVTGGEIVAYHSHWGLVGSPPGPVSEVPVYETGFWNGSDWTILSAGAGILAGETLFYSPEGDAPILFGGRRVPSLFTVGSRTTWSADAYTWNGSAWEKATAPTPPEREGAAAVYDAARSRVLLLSGGAGDDDVRTYEDFGDLWAFDGSDWSAVVTAPDAGSGTRPAMRYHAAAYDPASQTLIALGGALDAEAIQVSDLQWELHLDVADSPAQIFRCRTAAAGLGSAEIVGVRARWRAGGVGFPSGVQSDGAILYIGDRGSFIPGDSNTAGPDGPEFLEWTAASPEQAARLAHGASGEMTFAVASDVAGPDPSARVTSEYVEVSVRFRITP